MGDRKAGRRGRMAMAVAALGCAVTLGACTVPDPPGNAPLRYRDTVFTNTTVTSDLAYGSAPDAQGNPKTLTLDLYQPTGDTQTKRPAIVWIHGGAFHGGDKTSQPFPKLATQFAQRGYVAASINYRLLATDKCAGVHPPPASCVAAAIEAQHDAQAAVRWLRAHATEYGIDPTRIAVGGGSAGADTALLVGAHSEDPGSSGTPNESSKVGGVVSISGVLPHEGQDLLTSDDAPTLWFVGSEDPLIPNESDVVANAVALYNAGVLSVPEILQGAGHVPVNSTYGPTIYTQSANFLYFVLDLAHAAGSPPGNAAATDAMAKRLEARRNN
jgi:dienelactone hydrolase